jgi:hypothetical protein
MKEIKSTACYVLEWRSVLVSRVSLANTLQNVKCSLDFRGSLILHTLEHKEAIRYRAYLAAPAIESLSATSSWFNVGQLVAQAHLEDTIERRLAGRRVCVTFQAKVLARRLMLT